MTATKVYPVKLGWRIFLLICGLFFMAMGAAGLVLASQRWGQNSLASSLFLLVIILPFFAFGAATAWVGLRLRLESSATHIAYRYFFATRSVLWADVVGWRLAPTFPTVLILKLKKGQPRLEIGLFFVIGEEFWNRLEDTRDLDWEEAVREAEKIAADRSLGASPDETFDNLERAQEEAKWLDRIGSALALWAFLWPRPYQPLMAALILWPVGILIFVRLRAGLLQLDGTNKDFIPNVGAAWLLPVFALAWRRLFDLEHLSDAWGIALPCVLIGLAVFALMLWADRTVRANRYAAALALVFALAYGAGAAPMINRVLSADVPDDVFETSVLGKRIHDGKVVRYSVQLERVGEADIDKRLYDQTSIGQTLCCGIYSGVLNLKRIRVGACPLTPED